MSTISVSNIVTANGSESLTIATGNTSAGDIIIGATGGVVIASNSTANAIVVSVGSVANTLVTNSTGIYFSANIAGNTNFDSGVFFVDGLNNRVGVNNTTPTATLTVTGTINDSLENVRSLPIDAKTTTYTLASADNGKIISSNAGVTVNGALLVANQNFTIYNNSAASITITSGTGATMYLAGTATTGNRTLSQRGIASIICVAANTFVISGSGLS